MISDSEAEYIDAEKLREVRHEYVRGELYPMPASSRRHSHIIGNVLAALHAKQGVCNVYAISLKVHIPEQEAFLYPDVVVGCDEDEANDYYLEKPCLIVEVLSDSTAKRDRSEKLLAYMNILSLRAYLLVEQDQPEVQFFYREDNGNWWVQTYEGLDAEIELPCPELTLSLQAIYEDIRFG